MFLTDVIHAPPVQRAPSGPSLRDPEESWHIPRYAKGRVRGRHMYERVRAKYAGMLANARLRLFL
jgi:hypothetical protein